MPAAGSNPQYVEAVAHYGPTKRCSKCEEDLPLDSFRFREPNKYWLQSRCNACNAADVGEYMAAKRDWLNAYKLDKGCADCGYSDHPAALDLDHLPGHTKEFHVGQHRSVGWDKLLAEVEKCEVVCANCHRVRTEERRLKAVS